MSESLTESEKFALMELLVASYDRYLWEFSDAEPELESRVARLLEQDFEIHLHTIEYWSALKSHDSHRLYPVSSLMRRLIKKRETDA